MDDQEETVLGSSKQLGEPLVRPGASIVSPLRYPGAKRRLGGYIASTLSLNSLHPTLLVEPFAGGASVSLQLLSDGYVDQIALAEKRSPSRKFLESGILGN